MDKPQREAVSWKRRKMGLSKVVGKVAAAEKGISHERMTLHTAGISNLQESIVS